MNILFLCQATIHHNTPLGHHTDRGPPGGVYRGPRAASFLCVSYISHFAQRYDNTNVKSQNMYSNNF